MSARAEVRELLERHGLFAKKSLGQHFLVDDHALEAIAAAAVSAGEREVIEIGPGLGTLTARVLALGARVVAVERDAAMIPVLEARFGTEPRFGLVEADVLSVDFSTLIQGESRPGVVGNLPYNISTPILFRLLSARASLVSATVMIQREVADRILARPHTKAYGSLSVMLQTFADIRLVRHVAAGAFLPPPKVQSTVLRLDWRAAPRVPIADETHFERIVRAAFSHRRKTLRNSLGSHFERGRIASAEEASKLDFGRRAETLSLEEFAALAAALAD